VTPNKQVSPAIRILRGERDVSARATHLEAATGKFLEATNERKYMSTKTNFKRIALVAVAALGMGVLSSVPSQAVINGTPTLTTVSKTATKAVADSTTAATVTLKFNATTTDTFSVTASQLSGPATNTTNAGRFYFGDTATAFTTTTARGSGTAVTFTTNGNDSVTATAGVAVVGAAGNNSVTLLFQLDSATTRSAGTYTYTIVASPFLAAAAGDQTKVVTATVSIVVAATATDSEVASAGTSTAFISTTAANTAATTDAVPTVLATASTTPRAYINVNLLNAGSTSAPESLTVTTTVGTVGVASGAQGKSIVLPYAARMDVNVYSDGTAGTAVITIKSTSVTFANKSVVFYAAAPSTLVASVINSTPGIGATTAVAVKATDANGNPWAGTLYTYSSAVGTISNDAASCSYVAANSRHECSVTGVIAGTATITARDAATVATSTVSSNAVSLTVSSASPATVKLAFDKTSYAPGEKAFLTVSVLDSAGKSVPAGTFSNIFTTGGISLSVAAGNGSDTVTPVSVTTVSLAALALGTSTDPVKLYTLYMPASGGTVTASATGGTSLPLAGQVAVKATATVTDSGAAALAAVNALATTVASLRTLITTLTNLVLKIQKKVKA
jgi:hypothetical protein